MRIPARVASAPCFRSSSCCSTGSPTARTTCSAAAPATRPPRRRTSTRSPRVGSNGLLYAVGPGRAPSSEVAHWSMLGYRPDEFPGRAVFEALGRGQEVGDERRLRLRGAAPRRAARRRLVAHRPPDPDRDAEEAAAARRALRRDRGRRPDLLAVPRLARRGGPARSPAAPTTRVTDTDAFFRDRHPVLRPQPLVPEAERTARGGRGVDARGDAPARGRALQRDHAQVVGPAAPGADFRERHGVARGVRRRVGVPARPRDRASGSRRSSAPETDDPVGDLRGRVALVRERLDAGDTFVFVPPEDDRRGRPHEGSAREAGDDRAARRGARRPADRPRDRLHHRRPRDAGVARRDPLRRPGAARRGGPWRARRRRAALRRARLAPPASSASCAGPT